MPAALIALGSNLGDRAANLASAVRQLNESPWIQVVACSLWIETAAVGGPPDSPAYLNGAAKLETSLEPLELLDELQRVETSLGRRRDVRWGPRTIDLDLLLYEERVCGHPRLLLPHPRMAFRRFVLEPSAQVAPEMIHPPTGWTVRRLLEQLDEAGDQ